MSAFLISMRTVDLGAFVNALLLGGACVLLASHAITRLSTGATHFEAEPVLYVGIIGLAIALRRAPRS